MSISRNEAKQLLERIIFAEDRPSDWAQDVWDLSPTLGETAAKLIEVFDGLIECCSEEKLENFLQGLYQEIVE
jgi:hypothetical protein